MKGYARLVRAGYDPREAHKVFQHLADEVKALGVEEPYFFSSHPKLVERINAFNSLAAKHKGGGRVGSDTYNSIVKPIRLYALSKDLGQDRYKSVILVMEDKKMSRYYPSAGYYYLAEAYIRRDEKGDPGKALQAYHKAERLSPNYAPTFNRLGMYYMKKGDKGKARQYFGRYLGLAPKNARDRSYVEQYIRSLN